MVSNIIPINDRNYHPKFILFRYQNFKYEHSIYSCLFCMMVKKNIYKNKLNSSINEKKILRMFLRCLSLSCISIYVLLEYSRWIDLFDRNEWSTSDLNFWLVNSFIITIFLNIAYQTFPRAKHVFTAPLKKKQQNPPKNKTKNMWKCRETKRNFSNQLSPDSLS